MAPILLQGSSAAKRGGAIASKPAALTCGAGGVAVVPDDAGG